MLIKLSFLEFAINDGKRGDGRTSGTCGENHACMANGLCASKIPCK